MYEYCILCHQYGRIYIGARGCCCCVGGILVSMLRERGRRVVSVHGDAHVECMHPITHIHTRGSRAHLQLVVVRCSSLDRIMRQSCWARMGTPSFHHHHCCCSEACIQRCALTLIGLDCLFNYDRQLIKCLFAVCVCVCGSAGRGGTSASLTSQR